MSRTFPYVNETQGEALKHLQSVLQPGLNDFACKSFVPTDRITSSDLILRYYDGTKQVDQHLDFPIRNSLEADSVFDDLLAAAVISGFGRGREDVIDTDYRKAKEIKPPGFALSVDLLSASGVLSTLASSLLKGASLYAKPNKLNIYSTGGFFKSHWDTPRATNHVGTVTFCLPTRFTGGELIVRHGDESLTCDFAQDVISTEDRNVSWAFLFSGCQHEVLPVLSGTRITIAYDIYRSQEPIQSSLPALEDRMEQVMGAFQALLDGDLVASAADFLGFALSHHYPTDTCNIQAGPAKHMLKGVDALLMRAVEELGLSWKYVAVHELEWDGYSSSGERSEGHWSWRDPEEHPREYRDDDAASNDANSDDAGSTDSDWVPRTAADKLFRRRLCVTDDIARHEGRFYQIDVDHSPGPYRKDTLWVIEPQMYPFMYNYTACGNEGEDAYTMYATWAILVAIP